MVFTCKIICLVIIFFVTIGQAKRVHYIHWNRANPMFRVDNTDHVINVNSGNLPWEYDQVNIICPVTKSGVRFPERHVVYSVSREEYESCRVTNPKPKIVAVCSKPRQLLYFTITFRSFTPTPGGLEFHPGQDYYFISTSSPEDLHRRVGGGCATHNMRMVFRMAENGMQQVDLAADDNNNLEKKELVVSSKFPAARTSTTTEVPNKIGFNSRKNKYLYVYHPRDLFNHNQDNSIASFNEIETTYGSSRSNNRRVWKNEALKYTSSDNLISSGGGIINYSQTGFWTSQLLLCIWVKFLV